MKTKLLRKIRKRFKIWYYNKPYITAENLYVTYNARFDFYTLDNIKILVDIVHYRGYDELNKNRQYNRGLRKLNNGSK